MSKWFLIVVDKQGYCVSRFDRSSMNNHWITDAQTKSVTMPSVSRLLFDADPIHSGFIRTFYLKAAACSCWKLAWCKTNKTIARWQKLEHWSSLIWDNPITKPGLLCASQVSFSLKQKSRYLLWCDMIKEKTLILFNGFKAHSPRITVVYQHTFQKNSTVF